LKISIILPVYNAEKYVSAAIDSILQQTFTDFELLLINDASTDDSRAILENYAAQDRRIRLIDNPQNMGLTATLNKAIDLCRGEYIARMDADDISLPQRLETQAAFLDANPAIGFCGTWAALINADGQLTGEQWVMQLTPGLIHARMYFHNCFVHTSMMLRQKYAQMKYDAVNYPIQEDYEFWTRLVKITKGAVIPQILTHYRAHMESITASKQEKARNFTNRIILRELEELGLQPSPQEFDVHLSIGNQEISPNESFVESAYQWLLKLWTAFTRHYVSQPELNEAMRQLLGKFWLAILTQEGIAAKTTVAYANAPLSRQLLSWQQRLWLGVKNLL
jgi:glycosyltransferase involved in cell wall biosynthesis